MNYDEFVGHVQNRARVATSGDAVRATRATLETLSERLVGGEAKDLAAQLPQEIGVFLKAEEPGESFGLQEFYRRVSEKESVDLPDAVHHARSVFSVLREAVSSGELSDVRAQLPDQYAELFEAEVEGPQ